MSSPGSPIRIQGENGEIEELWESLILRSDEHIYGFGKNSCDSTREDGGLGSGTRRSEVAIPIKVASISPSF